MCWTRKNMMDRETTDGILYAVINNQIIDGLIDEILEVSNTLVDPAVGQLLITGTAEGTVVYIRKVASKSLITNYGT